jgi:serine/threonine protein kinase
MGSVELATYLEGPRAGQIVAVKRPHPHLERDPRFADWFFEEARITAGLAHPNVVEIYEWGPDARGRYLALEFVTGDSTLALLRDAKRASRAIPIGVALYIVRKTADGLHAAHDLRGADGTPRGLVHRDVSPSNILLSSDGQIKLIDFGVAKVRDELTQTTTGAIKGKLGYVSPEQARGERLDRRSDVFALGIVLWELLAGRRLFRAEAHLELLRMVVSDPIPPIRSVRPEVPDAIDAVLVRALAKDRDERFPTAAAFSEAIGEVARVSGYADGPAELAAFRAAVPAAEDDDDDVADEQTGSTAETRVTRHEPNRSVNPRSPSPAEQAVRATDGDRGNRRVVGTLVAAGSALALAIAGGWFMHSRSTPPIAAATARVASSTTVSPRNTAPSEIPVAPGSPSSAAAASPHPAPSVESPSAPLATRRRGHVVHERAPDSDRAAPSAQPVAAGAPNGASTPTAGPITTSAPRAGHAAARIFTPDWSAH